MTLKSISIQPLYRIAIFSIMAISFLLFIVQQSFTKPAKKKADIIFEDDIVKNKDFSSQLSIGNQSFYRISNNEFIYFTNFTPDPVAATKPTLSEVLYWNKTEKHDYFYISKNTQIEGKKIILHNPMLLKLNHKKNSFTMTNEKTKKLDNTLECHINKVESVHLSSLTLTELFQLKKAAEAFNLKLFQIGLHMALPFIHLFLFPLGISILIRKSILKRYD